ncbi:thymidylate synthase [Mariprofundus micogutta]|nr:thymidylate synthase [Mariprofundus micogutta]
MTILIAMGCLTSPASAAPMTATDKIVKTFMELDANDSEGVSRSEYRAMIEQRMNQRFREMDANRDGEVTADEYREFWLTKKAQWYRLQR